MERQEIFQRIAAILHETFDIDPARITPQASLGGDLDIDSIDAVDLVVKIREVTGKQIQAEEFKHVRHVRDVVDAIAKVL